MSLTDAPRTADGLKQHYAAVRARLGWPAAVPNIVTSILSVEGMKEVQRQKRADRLARETAQRQARRDAAPIHAVRIAEQTLTERMACGCPAPERVQAIKRAAALLHGMSVADIEGRSQRHDAVKARFWAVERVHALGSFSLPSMGRFFGRHHSSMHNALRKIAARHPSQPGE